MKLLNKEIFPLRNGGQLAVLSVNGKRKERLNIADIGISNLILFFHEYPKSDIDCSYNQSQNYIELGGRETQTERTLYLIAGK